MVTKVYLSKQNYDAGYNNTKLSSLLPNRSLHVHYAVSMQYTLQHSFFLINFDELNNNKMMTNVFMLINRVHYHQRKAIYILLSQKNSETHYHIPDKVNTVSRVCNYYV